MPLFRILGGGNSSHNAASNDPSNPNNNRLTYPGMRGATQPPTQTSRVGAAAAADPPAAGAGKNTPVSRPGAYAVTRTATGPAQVYRVTVPQGVQPGAEFTVHAGPRRARVRCPPTSRPGQPLQITLPPEAITDQVLLRMAPLTAPEGEEATGGASDMLAAVVRVNEEAANQGGTAQTYLVTTPPYIRPGQQFTAAVGGQRFQVTCPPTAGPNQKIRIVPPAVKEQPQAAPTQIFEVAVPQGVSTGQPFALVANGQRVLVTCPPDVRSGQKIRFKLPVAAVVKKIALSYESDTSGWRRTVRVSDLKFQWVRVDSNNNSQTNDKESSLSKKHPADAATTVAAGQVDMCTEFDFRRAAYVRKIEFLEGNDARMRTARLSLQPASEAVVDSKLIIHHRTLLSYADIAAVQGKALADKTAWLEKICTALTPPWDDGHIKIAVRRGFLLQDSVDAVMSLGREELRKRWRMEFLGEPALDAGGVTREWFELVTEQIFDPAFGLWIASANNQACVNINPASGVSCPDDHLIYFRFLGRVIGRALFDKQLIKGHMVQTIYKHMLGWPITFEDIKAQDEEYYQSLKKLSKMEDVSVMYLDFTATEERLGERREVNLMEGGAMTEVTNENLSQYLEANLRYRMLDRTKRQLSELLLGFYDVVPEPALTVFDANELELSLCGLPTIDMEDWKDNTNYSGMFEVDARRAKQVKWFWEVVEHDFDPEMRARLLQFVTGTSGVPSRGFSVLQGIDGNIKKFTIHGVDCKAYMYPRAHTCFNRIDLPTYRTKAELFERLKAAVTLCGVGFDIE